LDPANRRPECDLGEDRHFHPPNRVTNRTAGPDSADCANESAFLDQRWITVLESGTAEWQAPFMDPRIYQIASLTGLLVYGLGWLQFDLGWLQAVLTLGGVLAVQWACTRICKLPKFEPKSALISGLSLCLLLRTNSLWLVAIAVAITIGSKFVLRWRGKHLFNPTNFGLVAMLLMTDGRVWVSPGQWGNIAFFGFLMTCLGGLVVNRAARTDVTVAFLAFYVALVIGRSIYLGEPMTIPLHRLQSGALLLFAFFMVSDPKTTPDSRIGRILFAGLVAFGGWYVQFRLFATNGLLWSLATCSLLVPLIDFILPGSRYVWRWRTSSSAIEISQPQTALT
jgi:Na+-transporting NADH:ubiquinone oxidoreductase subunit NqrB